MIPWRHMALELSEAELQVECRSFKPDREKEAERLERMEQLTEALHAYRALLIRMETAAATALAALPDKSAGHISESLHS